VDTRREGDSAAITLEVHQLPEDLRASFAQSATERFDDPCVVTPYEAVQDGDLIWLAYERFEGETLFDAVRRSPLAPRAVLDALYFVARSLSILHTRRKVHRGLTPWKILLPADGSSARLLGVGTYLADEFSPAASQLAFMAPEINKKAPTTPATDVWSFALVAYEAMVNRRFFERESVPAMFAAILMEPIVAPSAQAAEAGVTLPAKFDSWFMRCVAREPEQRFQDIRDAMTGLYQAFDDPRGVIESRRRMFVEAHRILDDSSPYRPIYCDPEPLTCLSYVAIPGEPRGTVVVLVEDPEARDDERRRRRTRLWLLGVAVVTILALVAWRFMRR
jgi:serine/threonine protein kinase